MSESWRRIILLAGVTLAAHWRGRLSPALHRDLLLMKILPGRGFLE